MKTFYLSPSARFVALAVVFATLFCLLAPSGFAFAQSSILDNLGNAGKGMGTAAGDGAPTKDLTSIIGSIIRVILTLLGVLLLVYIVYGGVLWMTAGGDVEDVKKAKAIIQQAIIGVAIILAAYAISEFIVSRLASAALEGGAAAPTP